MSEEETNTPGRRYLRIKICVNYRAGDLLPSCGANDSRELAAALKEEIAKRDDFITLEPVHCLGKCHIGPTLKLLPSGPFLQGAKVEDAAKIAALLQAESYEELMRQFPDPAAFETVQTKP
ncbi:MAG: (2Fe-2S) ferredoxin domain-containing protein [Alphaproteobacteria bacterium]|nr:(2Fe-2S) ferredoxin domain-containing protein [Alphaproteobacteria bacterium]